MLIIDIISGNLDLIEALNGGVRPLIEPIPTFFVMEGGEANRIVNHEGLAELLAGRSMNSIARKLYYV